MAAQVFDFDAPLPERLYWDASFLVHAVYPAGRYHQECYAFLERLSDAREVFSYVSTLALDETIFTLIQLKTTEDHPEEGFWEVYRQNPQVIQPYLGEMRRLLERLSVDPRIETVGLEPASIPDTGSNPKAVARGHTGESKPGCSRGHQRCESR